MRSKLFYVLFALVLFSINCSASRELTHPTLQATLWVQNATEYKALTTMVYQTAEEYLQQALNDKNWTAELTQTGKDIAQLPPAIVLDIDETVLDNSPFQARMIQKNSDFDAAAWNKWVQEASAKAIPGAVAFTNAANDLGITVIYLSNRDAATEEATRENLKAAGFPISQTTDVVLLMGEKEEWTSAKTTRRLTVAENFRILMLFGDDFNDFLPAKNISEAERNALLEEHRSFLGKRWFMLPNPVYGSWVNAMYNFDRNLTPQQREALLKNHLHTGQ